MMPLFQPAHCAAVQACLGESPVWDSRSATLYFIDITAGTIYALRGECAAVRIYHSACRIGALALTAGGNLIFSEDAAMVLFCLSSASVIARTPAASRLSSMRYNDGACDPQGRFISGLMDETHAAASGSLHCYDESLAKSVLIKGIGLPNGIAWSASGEQIYYVDSVARTIYQASWCAASAQLTHRRIFAITDAALGRPDGIALDVAGNLWVCQFNGGCILQYSAGGALLQKVDIPVPRPTSCCFGGAGLTTLYITSAQFGLPPSELKRFPQSGDIFALQVAVAGLAAYRFDDSLFSERQGCGLSPC